ncbi:MAG: DNA-3-methyladenine glycosylase [Phycisphaerae bacterium]|jgi:DNA-3-methyladenine glycosylase|nr:DNA-3-methyladenine glycosylase [Phycisphaerae bacterium]
MGRGTAPTGHDARAVNSTGLSLSDISGSDGERTKGGSRVDYSPSVPAVDGLPDFTLPATELAPLLLGCLLVRHPQPGESGDRRAGVIVETEAYPGGPDRASHTFGGRRTPRVASMWRMGGHAYVYFTYGMHFCMNVVSGTAESGEAVLVRALEPCEGLDAMWVARGRPMGRHRWRNLCRGPARLCQACGIDRSLDGAWLAPGQGGLSIEPPRRSAARLGPIRTGPRIGVAYAGPWARQSWRFWVATSPFVSDA